jgi:hypothetical protein
MSKERMSPSLLNKRLNVQKMYLDESGTNIFEVVLSQAITQERKYQDVIVHSLSDNENPYQGSLSYGQDVRIGCIGVEYHNRWCFYFYDNKFGRTFINDFTEKSKNLVRRYLENHTLDIENSAYHAMISAMINCNQL